MSVLILLFPLASILLLGFAVSRIWKSPGDFFEIFRGRISKNVAMAFFSIALANFSLFVFIEILSIL